jgi:hypothetical protein
MGVAWAPGAGSTADKLDLTLRMALAKLLDVAVRAILFGLGHGRTLAEIEWRCPHDHG